MRSLSVSTHRGHVHWQGLLLLVSLLNFWSQPATAQLTVESINALEGTDVLLRIRNKPPNAIGLIWYKGNTTDSNRVIAFLTVIRRIHTRGLPDGPVIINYDGSLMLKKVTMKDAGIYTLLVRLQDCKTMTGRTRVNVYPLQTVNEDRRISLMAVSQQRETRLFSASGELAYSLDLEIDSVIQSQSTVRESSLNTYRAQLRNPSQEPCPRDLYSTDSALVSVPTLLASNTTVTENKDAVVMTCDTNAHAIHWLLNGTSLMLTERMKLSRDHRNLIIDPVQREDAGDYQCKASNPMNSATSVSLALDVKLE